MAGPRASRVPVRESGTAQTDGNEFAGGGCCVDTSLEAGVVGERVSSPRARLADRNPSAAATAIATSNAATTRRLLAAGGEPPRPPALPMSTS